MIIQYKDLEPILRRIAASPQDREAWELFYRRTWPFVFAYCYRLLRGRRDLAEDVSQDVFLRLLRSFDPAAFRNLEAFPAYLIRVCRSAALDALSQAHHAGEGDVPANQEFSIETLRSAEATPEQAVDASRSLRTILSSLDDQSLTLLKMIYGEKNRPLRDVAKELKISYGALSVRLHRLRQRVRKLACGGEVHEKGGATSEPSKER